MKQKQMLKYSEWIPDRPPSKGASAYHDAVVNTSWHKQNINELIKIIRPNIHPSYKVVDFGAGTGASAIYILKEIPLDFNLFLVDNSASWLGKAYEVLKHSKNISFILLEKEKNEYKTLNKTFGRNVLNYVISANTVHLIPNIKGVFKGIYEALEDDGYFVFQSGNIKKTENKNGILMIDDSINQVHDIAIDFIKRSDEFEKYKKNIDKRIKEEVKQRKFVFPTPRPISFYLDALRSAGFKNSTVSTKQITVKYSDWLNFLRVRRLQAGILPEIGGRDATGQEEIDRDKIITMASQDLFKKLKKQNPLANSKSFTAQWTYVVAKK
jgi:ubiquinone/menaquinone biosynthesis C-methylase UbiE